MYVPHLKIAQFEAAYAPFYPNFSHEQFEYYLSEFELAGAPNYLDKLSHGQKKKALIAFALATNTQILIMDEPTNGLDIPSKAQFRKAITKYTSEDSAVIISTHQVRDLENIIDPIIILDKQDVLLNASVEEISSKLFFDYGTQLHPGALYLEQTPGGCIQVYQNTTGEDSKVNMEALFNAVHQHKEQIKEIFKSC